MSLIDEDRTKLVKRYIFTLTSSRDRPEGNRKRGWEQCWKFGPFLISFIFQSRCVIHQFSQKPKPIFSLNISCYIYIFEKVIKGRLHKGLRHFSTIEKDGSKGCCLSDGILQNNRITIQNASLRKSFLFITTITTI